MQAPKIKVGSKTFTAQQPKTKIWREWIKFRRDFGDPEKVAEDPDADEKSFEKLLEILAEMLPDEVTPQKLEEETELVDFVNFAANAGVWIDMLVTGKAEQIPSKNAGKAAT